MTHRSICYLAAGVAAAWALYNIATLVGDGVYFRPGGHRSEGMWRQASESVAACALSIAIYLAAPIVLVCLGRRNTPD